MRFRTDGRHITAAIIAWYRSLKKSARIVLIVCIVHFSAIIWMSIDHFITFQSPAHKPIVVRTITPFQAPICARTEQKKQAPSVSRIPSQEMSHQKETKQVSIKPTKKISQTKKREEKTTSAMTVSSPKKKIKQEVLEDIVDQLASITTPTTKIRSSSSPDIHLPSFVESKSNMQAAVEENPSSLPVHSTYHVNLIDTLQNTLELPEIGEVLVKITIESPGKLTKAEILNTKSKKNADWLKNQLPLLELPSFTDFGIVDAFLEFTVKFTNVENSESKR